MRGQPGTRDYPEFPEIKERIGYNPAKWLHTRSASGLETGIGQTPEIAVAMSIVKGIDDAEEIAYWLQVESKCRNREHVLGKLNQRRRAIKHGQSGFLSKTDVAEQPPAARMKAATDGGEDGR